MLKSDIRNDTMKLEEIQIMRTALMTAKDRHKKQKASRQLTLPPPPPLLSATGFRVLRGLVNGKRFEEAETLLDEGGAEGDGVFCLGDDGLVSSRRAS